MVDQIMQDRYLMRIDNFILQNLQSPQLIFGLCKQLKISRTTLHNEITTRTAMPTTHYINSVKLSIAKRMLKETHLNISEIACQVGIPDPVYFTRLFRKFYEESPSHYRSRICMAQAT